MRTISVGLLGLGNVGAGVIKLLADNAAAIERRLGARLAVRSIAVREAEKRRLVDVDPALLTTRPEEVIDHPDVEIVAELIGGESPAREYVLRAIERGRQVVTANKALLATHGDEIFAAAERHGVDVYYEASVCGGVPILRALREGLASDRIDQILAIVNGTSNFILTRMAEDRLPFAEALALAQREGYAEADPALDVDGIDAAHKLAILARLSFGARVPLDQIYVEGLRGLEPVDLEHAERFGYVIKPLVIARANEASIEARVHPTMIPRRWLLALVGGVNNAVYVSSYALGQSMYYGRGAGMMPTAVAVVSDLLEVSRNLLARHARATPMRSLPGLADRPVRPIGELESRYYLRFGVVDRPGVLAQLARVLGEQRISIAQMVQEGQRQPERPVQVVMVTHLARERDVRTALGEIARLDCVAEPTRLVRILE